MASTVTFNTREQLLLKLEIRLATGELVGNVLRAAAALACHAWESSLLQTFPRLGMGVRVELAGTGRLLRRLLVGWESSGPGIRGWKQLLI